MSSLSQQTKENFTLTKSKDFPKSNRRTIITINQNNLFLVSLKLGPKTNLIKLKPDFEKSATSAFIKPPKEFDQKYEIKNILGKVNYSFINIKFTLLFKGVQGVVYEVVERNSSQSYAAKFYTSKDQEKLDLVSLFLCN